jgi:hypothetical protein
LVNFQEGIFRFMKAPLIVESERAHIARIDREGLERERMAAEEKRRQRQLEPATEADELVAPYRLRDLFGRESKAKLAFLYMQKFGSDAYSRAKAAAHEQGLI